MLQLILSELNVAQVDEYKQVLIQAVAMCCWYSAEKTLACLEAAKLTEPVFRSMFDYASKFSKDYELRRTLYGLISLIESPRVLPPVFIHDNECDVRCCNRD